MRMKLSVAHFHAEARESQLLLYSREIATRWSLVRRENRVQLENSLHTTGGNGICEMSNVNREFGELKREWQFNRTLI